MIPSSSRAWVSRASSGSCMTSFDHVGGHRRVDAPAHVHAPQLGRLALGAVARATRRSTSSSRSISSRWAVMERYSPAAMEKEPAIRPATPARRTIEPPGLAPGHAQDQGDVGDQAVAHPEDGRPGPAAAGRPGGGAAACASCSCAELTGVSVVRRSHAGSVLQRNQTLTSEERTMTTIVDGVDAFHELVGKELGHSEWQTDHPGAGQPLRRRHRRPPVDPRRPRAGQGRPLRRRHRPRLPDALAGPRPAQQDHPGRQHEVRRQLRLQQGPLPLPGAGRARSCAWA